MIGEPAARTSAEIESEPAVSRPALSVVIASTQPWPEARGCLESLLELEMEKLGVVIAPFHSI